MNKNYFKMFYEHCNNIFTPNQQNNFKHENF